VLVNNAEIGLSGQVVDFPAQSIDALLAVNVKGLFLCCQQAMRMMIPVKRGYIINLSSVVGFKGYANQAAYAASKHAVMGIMEALRPDLDKALLMKPEDVADAVLFLLSLSDSAAVDEICIRRRNSAPF
jgi:3-oxoacyl-[acyl-carrier protein] reductase